jgi:hypothetical protein
MRSDWQEFLTRAGAVIGDGAVHHFSDHRQETRAAATGDVVADLSHWSLIRAAGADTEGFLQGQLTNDVRQLGSGSQLSGYCTAQGRMLALLRVFKRDGNFYLQLPAALREAVLKRLRMFVLRAKVTLDSMDDELARIGVSGPGVEAPLRERLGQLPELPDEGMSAGTLTVLRLRGPHPRFEIVGPYEDIERLWSELALTPVGAGAWAWLDIMAGVPTVLPATVEAFVPQMTNLELIGGVNFKKGCYPGQEIVARTHYLGRLKQRMYRAHVDSLQAPKAGDPLYAPNFGEQAAGTVVEAQPAPDGGHDLLAVVQIASADAGVLSLHTPDGPKLTLHSLPYTLQ